MDKICHPKLIASRSLTANIPNKRFPAHFHVMGCLLLWLILSSSPMVYSEETGESLEENAKRLQMFVDKLPRMPIIKGYTETQDGQKLPANLTMGMYVKNWKFHRDLPPSQIFAYGKSKEEATVPGPTIESISGVKTYIKWENHLPDQHIFTIDRTLGEINVGSGVPTVVHLHGSVSEPQSDGNALAWFTRDFREKGPNWRKELYEYENVGGTANMWYHDHAMAYTRLNILAGLMGAYKVINPALEHHVWKLPGKSFDVELVIMDRSFTQSGQIYINRTGNNPSIHPEWQPEYFGDVMIVNGKAWPYMKVQRRKYRFRIINASNARFYRLSLNNGMNFTQIGSDSFYLRKPLHMSELLMAPSEIADVIIDFAESKARSIILMNDAKYPFPDGDDVDDMNSKVMKFFLSKQHYADDVQVPKGLVEVEKLKSAEDTKTRDIILYEFATPSDEPTHLLINFKNYTDPVTEKPKNGSLEIWRVINLTDDNHPFHVHLVAFQVLGQRKINNKDELSNCVVQHEDVEHCNLEDHLDELVEPPPPTEVGWKNVYKVQPSYVTTILIRFSLLDGTPFPFDPSMEPGYAYHCHILDHEDNAMMRPYAITL